MPPDPIAPLTAAELDEIEQDHSPQQGPFGSYCSHDLAEGPCSIRRLVAMARRVEILQRMLAERGSHLGSCLARVQQRADCTCGLRAALTHAQEATDV